MKLKRGIQIILSVLICGLLFEILFGSHPIISFVDYRYDIENNPVGDIRNSLAEQGYYPVTLSVLNNSQYQLSNGLIVNKEHIPSLKLTSALKDTILFSDFDSSFYYNRMPLKSCVITCIKYTVPLKVRRFNRYIKGAGKLPSNTNNNSDTLSQIVETSFTEYPYAFITPIKKSRGILLDSVTLTRLQNLIETTPHSKGSLYPKTHSHTICIVTSSSDVSTFYYYQDTLSEMLLHKQYISVPYHIDSALQLQCGLLKDLHYNIKLHFMEFDSSFTRSKITSLLKSANGTIYHIATNPITQTIGAAFWIPAGREMNMRKAGKELEGNMYWDRYRNLE